MRNKYFTIIVSAIGSMPHSNESIHFTNIRNFKRYVKELLEYHSINKYLLTSEDATKLWKGLTNERNYYNRNTNTQFTIFSITKEDFEEYLNENY